MVVARRRAAIYAAAVAGDREAQRGLATVIGKGRRAHWRTVSRDYRMWHFGTGEEGGDSAATLALEASAKQRQKRKCGYSRQEVEAVLRSSGKLPLPEKRNKVPRHFFISSLMQ